MIKRILAFTFLATLTAEAAAQQWPELRQEAKAGARWWWLGSAVDKENLRWTMQEYANHGIGALEITPIYGVKIQFCRKVRVDGVDIQILRT